MGAFPSAVMQNQGKQPDPYETVGNALKLKQAMQMAPLQQQQAQQQVQSGALDLQMKQQQLKDQQAMTKALQSWDASKGYDGLASEIIKNGGSANAAMAVQKHGMDLREQKAKVGTAELSLENQKHDLMLGTIKQIQSLPDEQLAQSLAPAAQDLVQRGLLDPQHAQMVQQLQGQDPKSIRNALDIFSKGYMGEKEQNARIIKEREVSAQEMTAQGRKAQGDAALAKNAPLPLPQIGFINKQLQSRYQVLNPGQPLPPEFTLQPGAKRQDWEDLDKSLEQVEKARATKAQQDTANAMRSDSQRLAFQNAQDRREEKGMTPVVGNDANGNRMLVSRTDAEKMGLTGITKADADLQNKSEAARHWITLASKVAPEGSPPDKMGIMQLVDKMDKEGKLGPIASRWNEFLAGKVGAGDPDVSALRAKMGLSTTKLMQAHVGSRGGAFIMEHFEDLANQKKMDGPTLKQALGSELDYMRDVAMLPPDKSAKGNSSTPSNDFWSKFPKVKQ